MNTVENQTSTTEQYKQAKSKFSSNINHNEHQSRSMEQQIYHSHVWIFLCNDLFDLLFPEISRVKTIISRYTDFIVCHGGNTCSLINRNIVISIQDNDKTQTDRQIDGNTSEQHVKDPYLELSLSLSLSLSLDLTTENKITDSSVFW